MEASNLGYQVQVLAIYIMTTSLKCVSSMKLHSDLDITQKLEWHIAHRVWASFDACGSAYMNRPVKADESHFAGREANKHANDNAVEGVPGGSRNKDRSSNQLEARVVQSTNVLNLVRFVERHALHGASVYTDGASTYGIRIPWIRCGQ